MIIITQSHCNTCLFCCLFLTTTLGMYLSNTGAKLRTDHMISLDTQHLRFRGVKIIVAEASPL